MKNAIPATSATPTIAPTTAPTMIPVLSEPDVDAVVVTVAGWIETTVIAVTLPYAAGFAAMTALMAVVSAAVVMALEEATTAVNVIEEVAESTR